MQDRVPLYPGRVTLTPVSGQANTYDMARADQPSQEGTPLNKGSLLKDSTAALFGLGTDAVPDDALAILSRFHKGLGNEFIWSRSSAVINKASVAYVTLGTTTQGNTIYYSDTVAVNGSTIVLQNPSSVNSQSMTAGDSTLSGKYFYISTSASSIYYVDSSATMERSGTSYLIKAAACSATITPAGYVNSPNDDAYPPAVSDGYTYRLLGQVGGASRFVLLKEITTSEAITGGVLELDLSDINFADYQFVHMDCKMMATTQVLYYVNNDKDHCGNAWMSVWSSGAHGGSGQLGYFGDDDRYHFTVRITFPSGKEGSRIVSCHRSGNYFGLCTTVTFDTLTSMQFSCSGTIKAGTIIRVWGEG